MTLASTVMAPNGFATWKVRARPCAQMSCGLRPTISRPNAMTEPESGAVKAGDEMKARGLAGAVRSDQRDGLVFLHRKTDVLHRAQAAEPLAETPDDQRVRHG